MKRKVERFKKIIYPNKLLEGIRELEKEFITLYLEERSKSMVIDELLMINVFDYTLMVKKVSEDIIEIESILPPVKML